MPVKNLDTLSVKLNKISDESIVNFMNNAGLLVELTAKKLCPKKNGKLMKSIKHSPARKDSNGVTVTVGTNVDYAPYVHEGTGIYATNGKGTQGYWIYVKSGGDANYQRESEHKVYATLKEVKKAVAIMYSYHPDWTIFYTNGQKPQPFLTDALHECTPLIRDELKEEIKEAINNVRL